MMTLSTLLDTLPKRDFCERYLHKQPYSAVGTAKFLEQYGSWETVVELLQGGEADVMVVRDGAQLGGRPPTSQDELAALNADGYTILIRHAERHHDKLAEVAASVKAELLAPVDIHIYATPSGQHGFSWHYDAEDVFIIQTAGEKEYSLRKNTVNPWPLVETIPHNMQYEREITPLMRVLLRQGDWLYIPCGYWHKAETPDSGETAISLAVGVMSAAAIGLYDMLRPQLLESLVWRQRLPIVTHNDSSAPRNPRVPTTEELWTEIRRQLIADFTRAVTELTSDTNVVEALRRAEEERE